MFDWERGRMFNRLSINVVSRRGSLAVYSRVNLKQKTKKTGRSRLSEVEIAEFLTKN